MIGRLPGTFRLIPILLAFAALACQRERAPEQVRLRLLYEAGDTLHYEYRAQGTVTHPDSAAGDSTVSERYERRMTIDEVATEVTPRGHYLLAWTYHLPRDSVSGETPDPVTLEVEITPQGRVMDVRGVETARRLFGDLDFRTYLEQTQPVFPERPLALGDSWTQEVHVLSPRGETVITRSTYVLERIADEAGEATAVIGFDGDVYLPIVYESETPAAAPAPSTEERIRARGRIYFAHEQGMTRRVETTARATLIKVASRDGEMIRQEVQFSQESVLRLVDR